MQSHLSSQHDRLWTPWRMRYVAGGPSEAGCLFCNRLNRSDDIESLILYRAEHCFVIMNLYPYNSGHLMIVPNDHAGEIDLLEPQVLAEMASLLPPVVRVLRKVLGCDGFNIGFNQGSVAGAGVAAHLHQHVVPRWEGDANFMPILAGTMVIPELIPSSYAKIRAEIDSELHGVTSFEVVLLDTEAIPSVWLSEGSIPVINTTGEKAAWRSATQQLNLIDADFVGYSGSRDTRDRVPPPGLVVRTTTILDGVNWTRHRLFEATDDQSLPVVTRNTLLRALGALSPWVGPNNRWSSPEDDPVD